jgi:hypothetical protein
LIALNDLVTASAEADPEFMSRGDPKLCAQNFLLQNSIPNFMSIKTHWLHQSSHSEIYPEFSIKKWFKPKRPLLISDFSLAFLRFGFTDFCVEHLKMEHFFIQKAVTAKLKQSETDIA